MTTLISSHEPNPDEDRDWLDWLQRQRPYDGDGAALDPLPLPRLEPHLATSITAAQIRGRR